VPGAAGIGRGAETGVEIAGVAGVLVVAADEGAAAGDVLAVVGVEIEGGVVPGAVVAADGTRLGPQISQIHADKTNREMTSKDRRHCGPCYFGGC
jgi:hypothetical protein